MSKQLKHTVTNTEAGKTAKVYRDSEWNQFVVRLYQNGVLQPAADYFESFNKYDRQSVVEAYSAAVSTAQAMCKQKSV